MTPTGPPIDPNDLFVHQQILADPNQSLLRVDRFLIDRLPNVSRNRIQSALKDGFIMVNDRQVKPNYKVHPGDLVTIALPTPPRDTEVVPEDIPLRIVFEDDHLLIVDKPSGMVVHPAYNNWTGTLVNALVYHFQNLPEMKGNEGRPGLVHRIDKDTSGLLVVAKNEQAMTHLARQFFQHSIERSYHAVVWGEMDPEGTIDVNLGRSEKDRRITTAYPEIDRGRRAVTHYKLLESLRYISYIECKLETGRTHQIRAHMNYLGHPIFNDATYGGDKILKGNQFSRYKTFVQNCFKLMPRQALHAKSLGFVHPVTKAKMSFDSELPPEFVQLLTKWRSYIKDR